MTYSVPRDLVDASTRSMPRAMPKKLRHFSPTMSNAVIGPVDYLPFCGIHRGKAAVIDLMTRQVPSVLRVYSVVVESF